MSRMSELHALQLGPEPSLIQMEEAIHEILWIVDGCEDIDGNDLPNLAMRVGNIARAALAKGQS